MEVAKTYVKRSFWRLLKSSEQWAPEQKENLRRLGWLDKHWGQKEKAKQSPNWELENAGLGYNTKQPQISKSSEVIQSNSQGNWICSRRSDDTQGLGWWCCWQESEDVKTSCLQGDVGDLDAICLT